MAEKKSGPVKPPIIDAKPRTADADKQPPRAAGAVPPAQKASPPDAHPETGLAGTGKPADAAPGSTPKADQAQKSAAPASDAPPRPEPQKPVGSASPLRGERIEPAPRTPVGALMAAAGGGAAIAVAIGYGLTLAGLWPQPSDPGIAAALADLERRNAALETRLADTLDEAQVQAGNAATRIEALEADLSARIEALATLAQTPPEGFAASADLDALQADVTALAARIEALAAGASGEQSEEIAGQLVQLANAVTALGERLDAVEPELSGIGPALADAQVRLDDLDQRIADQPAFDAVAADRDRMAQVSAARDALDAAIASGEPFAGVLATIEALQPGLAISEEARAAATAGAPQLARLRADFGAAIPAMLAARPPADQGNWAQTLLDQAAAAVALRPTEGDGPEALVGRTEAALERGDAAAARDAFAGLPQPMQAAAPGFAEALDRHLAAQALRQTVRSAEPESLPTEGAL